MAIKVQCGSCSSSFQVKDELAGRRVKCPKCKDPLTIGKPAAMRGAAPAAAAHNPLLDLLDEQNVRSVARGPVCENCGIELQPGAVVCIECGFNHETGESLRTEIYQDDLSAQSSDGSMSDADRLMAKAEKDISESPVTADGQDFGDGADSYLIAAVAGVIGLVLIGVGLTVILTMEQVNEYIASSAISLIASAGLYIAMGLWITIVAFKQKQVHGVVCVCTAFLWCIVFGFMRGKQLLLPTIILLVAFLIGAASGAYTYYNGWKPGESTLRAAPRVAFDLVSADHQLRSVFNPDDGDV